MCVSVCTMCVVYGSIFDKFFMFLFVTYLHASCVVQVAIRVQTSDVNAVKESAVPGLIEVGNAWVALRDQLRMYAYTGW